MRTLLPTITLILVCCTVHAAPPSDKSLDAIAFYRSPAGAAMIDKMPVVQQKSLGAMQPLIPPMIHRIDDLMKQSLADLKAAK